MITHSMPSCLRKSKNYSCYATGPGAIINPHWLELLLSQTNFHGPKSVRAIEVRLYFEDYLMYKHDTLG